MKTKFCAAALIFVLTPAIAARAKPPTIPLECAKSSGAVAERKYLDAASGGGNIYNVNVTFTGKKPTNAKAEAALRECIAASTKMDRTKDVVAFAWLKPRPGASDNDDELLHPFGAMKFISYTATTGKVAVRAIDLTRK